MPVFTISQKDGYCEKDLLSVYILPALLQLSKPFCHKAETLNVQYLFSYSPTIDYFINSCRHIIEVHFFHITTIDTVVKEKILLVIFIQLKAVAVFCIFLVLFIVFSCT